MPDPDGTASPFQAPWLAQGQASLSTEPPRDEAWYAIRQATHLAETERLGR